MKRCPKCESTDTADTLRFCLQDGTPLVSVSRSSSASDAEKTLVLDSTERRDEPPPTEILGPAVLPTVASSKAPVTTPQRPRPTETGGPEFTAPLPHQPPPKEKSNAFVIPVTIGVTVLLLAVVGLGAWLFLGNKNGAGPGNTRADGERTTRTPAAASSP